MNYIKKVSAIVFIQFALYSAYGQTGNITREHNVTPVTPEAAALAKIVNYPINYNTGIPDIRIPLYEINASGMVLPIELVYHAGGFKINEQAGRVGMGWSLSCDLQITRTIYGMDDFYQLGLLNGGGYLADANMKLYDKNYPSSHVYPIYPNIYNPTDMSYLMNQYKLATGILDGMPDKFYYKLLNKSGSFFFTKDQFGNPSTIIPVPYDNIKIEYSNGAFIIIDTDGTTYYFGLPGNSVDVANNPAQYGIEFSGKEDGIQMLPMTRTTWKCMYILRMDNGDYSESISFTYSKQYVEGDIVYAGKKTCTYRDKIEYWNNFHYGLASNYPRKYADDFVVVPDEYENIFAGCQCNFYQLSSPKFMVTFGGSKKEFHLPYLNGSYDVIDKTYSVRNDPGPNHDPLKEINYVQSLKLDKIEYRGGKVEFIGNMNKIDSIRITDNLKTKTIKLFQNFTVPNEITLGQAQNFNGLHFLGTNYLDSIRIGDDKHCFIYRDKYCFGNHQRGHDAWGHVNNQTKELSSYNIAHPLLTTPRQRKKIKHKMANVTKPFEFGGQCKLVEQPNEQLMQKGILKRIVYPTGGFVDFDFEANKYEETYNKSYIGKDNLVMRNGGGLRIRSINYYSGDSYQASLQKYYRYGNYEEGSGLMADAPEVTMNGNNWDWRWDYKGFDYTQIINYSYVTNQGELSTLLPPVQDSLTVYLPASALDYTYANGAPVYYTKVTEYQQDMGVQTGKTVYKYYPPDKFYSDPLYFKKKMIDGTNIPHIKVDWHLGALESVAQYKYMEGKFQLYHLKKMEYDHTKFRKNQTPRVVFSFPHTIRQPILNAYTDQAYKLYDCMTGEYGLPVGRLLISKETEKWFESAGDSIVQTTNYCYDNNTYIQPTKIEKTNSTGSQIITLKYPYDETGTVYTEMVSKKIFNPVIQETITIQDNATNLEISKIRVNYRKTPTGYFVRDKIESSVQGQPLTEELRFDSYDNNINVTQTTHRNLAVKSYLWGYTGRYLVAEIENATFASASALLTPTGVGVLDNPTTAESDKIIELEKLDQLPNAMVNAYTWRLFAGVETHISPQKTKTTYDYDLSGRLKTIKDHDKNVVQSFEYKTLKSSLISNEMFYTNMPRMDTDEMICGTGLLGINNRFYLGGQEKIFYQPNYSIEAFPQWGLIENDTYNTCAAASGFVKITLRSILLDSPSRYVVFDFYKDGAIFASKTFYCYSSYQNQPSNPKDIYLPVGEYNVVLRTGAQSYDDVHLVLQYDDTTGIYKYITYNDKVNFQSGLLYTFWVMDAY